MWHTFKSDAVIYFGRQSHKRGHKKIQPAKTPILSGFSTFIRQNSGKRFCRVKRHFSFVIGLELFHNLLTNHTIWCITIVMYDSDYASRYGYARKSQGRKRIILQAAFEIARKTGAENINLPTMHWNTMKIRSIPIWSGHTEAQYWQHRRKRHERMYRRCRHIGWQAKRGATNGRNPEIALALLPKMRRQNKNADTGTYSLGGFSFILPEVQIYLRNSF